MTKAETDFAEEDLAIARRALWSLEWPSRLREQPPADLDLERLSNFQGRYGALEPLVHFALIRHADALRSGRPSVPVRPTEEGAPALTEPQRRAKMREDACAAEKKAIEQLREAKLRTETALEHWRAAVENRAELYCGVPLEGLTGEPEAILAELLDADLRLGRVLTLMDRALRWQLTRNEGDPFPSLLGLPKAERNAGLKSQALRLHEAEYSEEQITYVMGWSFGKPEQVRERVRRRLDTHARVRPPSLALVLVRAPGGSGPMEE